jgi:hypothetical protein
MRPSVTFAVWGGYHVASTRYRTLIPVRELTKRGFKTGKDWLVIGKHGWDWDEQTKGYARVCFDVCDDHFAGKWGDFYRRGIRMADLVTCPTRAMAARIWEETHHLALVIPDPYEQPEKAPRIGETALWFGHGSNLADIAPYVDRFPIEIVSNVPGVTQWSPEEMDRAFDRAGFVVIPTGKSMAKSGNRAIESIRRGLFVIAGFLPAYADLGIYTGDIEEGIQWAMSHQDEVLRRIKASQAYIRTEYSPERIGGLWASALS